jgi:hypothetical protein
VSNTQPQKPKFDIEMQMGLCEGYIELWSKIYALSGDDLPERKITGKDEAEFFDLVSNLSKRQFRIGYFLSDEMDDPDTIIDVLNRAVSLTHLQAMSEAELGKFQHDWHAVYIALNKALGRLMEKRPVSKKDRAHAREAAGE